MVERLTEEKWKLFVDMGAFKLLALAGLSGNTLSVVCYLINCFVSGIPEVLTSSRELSVLLGMRPGEVEECLEVLVDMNIVKLQRNNGERMIVCLMMDPTQWKNLKLPAVRDSGKRRRIGDAANVRPIRPQKPTITNTEEDNLGSSLEALSFPMDPGQPKPERTNSDDSSVNLAPIERVLQSFLDFHPEADEARERTFAETLVATQPTDQVLTMVKSFGAEIRSLGLLVGAWVHYSQKLDKLSAESNTSSLEEYRKQTESSDRLLREAAKTMLKREAQGNISLSTPERVLLHVFEEHDMPRRQLYWALQMTHRYPALKEFFNEVRSLAHAPTPFPSSNPPPSGHS